MHYIKSSSSRLRAKKTRIGSVACSHFRYYQPPSANRIRAKGRLLRQRATRSRCAAFTIKRSVSARRELDFLVEFTYTSAQQYQTNQPSSCFGMLQRTGAEFSRNIFYLMYCEDFHDLQLNHFIANFITLLLPLDNATEQSGRLDAKVLKPSAAVHESARPTAASYWRESIAASSASTISRTSCRKLPAGVQPSVLRIFFAQPTRRVGSVGRSNEESCFTYFSHGRSTTEKATSTNSRTECVSPVATT